MAGRNLIKAEWHTYFPDDPTPRSICTRWPAPQ
jgi:hypothetical protein